MKQSIGKWRVYLVAFLLTITLCAIIFRLYWIQMVTARSFSQEQADLITQAEEQQSRTFTVDSRRGEIVDRKGKRLTATRECRLIVFPFSQSQLSAHDQELQELVHEIGYSYHQFVRKVTSLYRPAALTDVKGQEMILTPDQARKINSMEVPGIYALQSDDRFASERVAQQVIGQVGRNPFLMKEKYPDEWEEGLYQSHFRIGLSGLEFAFEPFLRGGDADWISYATDGQGRPLNGLHNQDREEVGEKKRSPYRIVTTLDREMQSMVEKKMDEMKVKEGAVVVQHIASGDIRAMASRPNSKTAQEEDKPWDNRGLMETTPGSIFKTVVAIAALDTGKVKPTDMFDCNGKLEHYGLRDSGGKGHGTQTLAQAYANSCNIVFAQVAEKVGGKTIEEYAKKLGLGQPILWSGKVFKDKDFHQLPAEQSGLIFSESTSLKDPGVVVQTAIGQRDVRMTPLQATNMVTALFHGGKVRNPRIVQEIRKKEGKSHFRFTPHALKSKQNLHPNTLHQVRQMMRLTVTQGTAQSMKDASIMLAGKTGTAQLGMEGDRFNKWMVGYAPADHPRYAVAVLIRSVTNSKDMRAQRLFRQVMEGLEQIRKDQEEKEPNG